MNCHCPTMQFMKVLFVFSCPNNYFLCWLLVAISIHNSLLGVTTFQIFNEIELADTYLAQYLTTMHFDANDQPGLPSQFC